MFSKFLFLSAIVLLGSFVKPVKTNDVINFKEQKTRTGTLGGVTNIKAVVNNTHVRISLGKREGNEWV